MKVLHDWDRLEVSGRWARNRGLSLLLYALGRKFTFLNRIKYMRENSAKIEGEKLAYMRTLIKLNKLCGIDQIFGIRDIVKNRYAEEINALRFYYSLDVRRHIHIGENDDPYRIRSWIPPLPKQTYNSWHFDTKFARGKKVALKSGELAIFHVDYPFHLALYIDYLFEEMRK